MTMSAKVRCGWMKFAAVDLAPSELGQDLLPGIAALRGVAVHLPLHPELLLGIEIDLHVVAIAHGARGIAEQAFGDDEAPWA